MILAACGRVGFEPTRDAVVLGLAACADCGDADGNGTVDVADVTAVAQQLTGLGAVPCPTAADTNADGAVTRRDLNTLVFGVTGRAIVTCGGCAAIRCGDLTADGRVDQDDNVALAAILTAPEPIDGCLAWRADTSGDGSLDDDDALALDDLLAGGDPQCAP